MRPARSVASRVFVVLLIAALVVGGLVAVFLVIDAQRTTHAEAERVTAATAVTLAASPLVTEALDAGDVDAATRTLEPYALDVIADADLDFVTIMTPDGTRVTHPDVEQIGEKYLGTIPDTSRSFTEVFTGTLGPSVRTIVPVDSADGDLVGWVSAGVTTESISDTLIRRLPCRSESPSAWSPWALSEPGLLDGSRGASRAIFRQGRCEMPCRRMNRCGRSAMPCGRRRTSMATACTPLWLCSSWGARRRRSGS